MYKLLVQKLSKTQFEEKEWKWPHDEFVDGDYVLLAMQVETAAEPAFVGSKSWERQPPVMVLFGLRKLNQEFALLENHTEHMRNRRAELMRTFAAAVSDNKAVGKKNVWLNKGTGGLVNILSKVPTLKKWENVELDPTIRPDQIQFFEFDGEKLPEDFSFDDGTCSELDDQEIQTMLSWLLQDKVDHTVSRRKKRGAGKTTFKYEQKFRCPLRRNLSYTVQFYDQSNVPHSFPKAVLSQFQTEGSVGEYLFLHSRLHFFRGVGDLKDVFSVALVRKDMNLDKTAGLPFVIYREELEGMIGRPELISNYEDATPSAFKGRAFVGGEIIRDPTTNRSVGIKDRTQLDIQRVTAADDGFAHYVNFKLPQEHHLSLEPVLFSFDFYSARKRTANYLPFSLSEETLGVSFRVDFSEAALKNTRLVKFTRAMPGHDAPRSEDLGSKSLRSIGFRFDEHSLPAGEGALFFWNYQEEE